MSANKIMLISVDHAGSSMQELRIAIVDIDKNDKAILSLMESEKELKKRGNIYNGVVRNIAPSLGAAFIEYDNGRHGFLSLKEVNRYYFPNHNHNPELKIQDVLKIGQKVLVQVDKEERGNKGAALSTFISLAGSYLVLMPNSPHGGGVSRQIKEEEREQMRQVLNQLNINDKMSVIIRTAGIGRSLEELQWDLDNLLRHWEEINKAANQHNAPCLIHQEGNALIRAIRDYLRPEINEIIVDDMDVYQHALTYIKQARSDFVKHLKLYQERIPLFAHYQIEQQIEMVYQREVRLPSGGMIYIDQTEALVSIDVNSSKATQGSNIEETALNTNLEAAEAIARQLRLRDIGGLIVIDFIDMISPKNQRSVEDHLRQSLKLDRARIQIGRISRFGLLEMSRQRLKQSISETNQVTCPTCAGRGSIRGVESSGSSTLRIIEEQILANRAERIEVQLPLDIATYLLNERKSEVLKLEERHGSVILLIPNPQLHSPNYRIKTFKSEAATSDVKSYKLFTVEDQALLSTAADKYKGEQTEVDKPIVSVNQMFGVNTKTSGPSLIKRLWSSMFGSSEASDSKEKQISADFSAKNSNKDSGSYKGNDSGGDKDSSSHMANHALRRKRHYRRSSGYYANKKPAASVSAASVPRAESQEASGEQPAVRTHSNYSGTGSRSSRNYSRRGGSSQSSLPNPNKGVKSLPSSKSNDNPLGVDNNDL